MPVRKIPRSHTSITGRHAMGPGQRSIGFESTLERDFVRLMAFDPNFIGIEEQPVRIVYEDTAGRKHHYTPDYLVQRRNAPTLLAEIKPKKFIKPDLEPKFTASRRYARERGWVFEVWTEREIRTTRLANIQFLEPYRYPQADPGRTARILRHLESDGPMSGASLLRACWSDKTEWDEGMGILWQLIATKKLHADLDRKLTLKSVLQGTGRTS